MKSLSHKRAKRVLIDKIIRKELGKINLDLTARVTLNPTDSFLSVHEDSYNSTQTPKYQEQDSDKIIPGEYFEPDDEIIEIAFNYKPVLSKKDLSDSGIYALLSGLDKTETNLDSFEDFLGENILFQLQYASQY